MSLILTKIKIIIYQIYIVNSHSNYNIIILIIIIFIDKKIDIYLIYIKFSFKNLINNTKNLDT